MSDYLTHALSAALGCLHARPAIAVAVSRLQESTDAINADLAGVVLQEVSAFAQSGNPDVLPELSRHAPLHTLEILRLLSGSTTANFDFVRQHAQLRAEQHFPIEYTLHAYRCGHKVFSRILRDAVLAEITETDSARQIVAEIADFTLEYTDAISSVFAAAYLAQSQFLMNVAGDRRTQLLNILLNGYDESDRRVTRILREAGYLAGRQSYCVVLAQPVDSAEMLNPDRARRLANAIEEALALSSIRSVVELRDNKVTVICSHVRRLSGWTHTQERLVAEVAHHLTSLGPSVFVGISNAVPATGKIPTAYKQAQHALEFASRGNSVALFQSIPLQRLLLHMAGDEFQSVLPEWAHAFIDADKQANGALIATLRAYANADMNILKTAKALKLHPNTIYARFQRISTITGRDSRSYHALTNLLLVNDKRLS